MATDGPPKDYSSMYCEDNNNHNHNLTSNRTSTASNLTLAANHRINKTPIPSSRNKTLDGSFAPQKHREQTIDLRLVAEKLAKLEDHRAYAMDTLNKHYSSVFLKRRSPPDNQASYRAYIQYFDAKDTYVVRVEKNTLRAIRDKLPKRGNYRYFFKNLENTCEEVEFDGSTVPFHEKDGLKQIYCQVFPC